MNVQVDRNQPRTPATDSRALQNLIKSEKAYVDDLLGATGLGDAAPLAARFGIDIRDEAFWASSLAVIGDRIDAALALMP